MERGQASWLLARRGRIVTDNINLAAYPDSGETPENINEVLRRRVERAEQEEIRLSGLLVSARHELAILERAVETTQQLSHERFASNAALEHENETLRANLHELQCQLRACCCASKSDDGVTITIPHLTETFTAVIEVFNAHWAKFDRHRPPKSAAIARALDERMGWKSQRSGDPSRGAQAFAAAMRPDALRLADGRNHRRNGAGGP
jgi:hypothetical protein